MGFQTLKLQTFSPLLKECYIAFNVRVKTVGIMNLQWALSLTWAANYLLFWGILLSKKTNFVSFPPDRVARHAQMKSRSKPWFSALLSLAWLLFRWALLLSSSLHLRVCVSLMTAVAFISADRLGLLDDSVLCRQGQTRHALLRASGRPIGVPTFLCSFSPHLTPTPIYVLQSITISNSRAQELLSFNTCFHTL